MIETSILVLVNTAKLDQSIHLTLPTFLSVLFFLKNSLHIFNSKDTVVISHSHHSSGFNPIATIFIISWSLYFEQLLRSPCYTPSINYCTLLQPACLSLFPSSTPISLVLQITENKFYNRELELYSTTVFPL